MGNFLKKGHRGIHPGLFSLAQWLSLGHGSFPRCSQEVNAMPPRA